MTNGVQIYLAVVQNLLCVCYRATPLLFQDIELFLYLLLQVSLLGLDYAYTCASHVLQLLMD